MADAFEGRIPPQDREADVWVTFLDGRALQNFIERGNPWRRARLEQGASRQYQVQGFTQARRTLWIADNTCMLVSRTEAIKSARAARRTQIRAGDGNGGRGYTQHFHPSRHSERMRKWARDVRDGKRILVRCPSSTEAEGAWLVNWPETMRMMQIVEHEASRGITARPSSRTVGPLDKYINHSDRSQGSN